MQRRSWIAAATIAASLAATSTAWAQRTVDEYRYFRALSIDLQGRIPTRDEIAAFERPDFNTERWVDDKLQSPAYAERMRTLYAQREALYQKAAHMRFCNSAPPKKSARMLEEEIQKTFGED